MTLYLSDVEVCHVFITVTTDSSNAIVYERGVSTFLLSTTSWADLSKAFPLDREFPKPLVHVLSAARIMNGIR